MFCCGQYVNIHLTLLEATVEFVGVVWWDRVGQGGTGWNSKLLSCQAQLQFRRLIFCCGLIEVVSVISKGLENSQHLFVLRLYSPKQMARTPGFKER